MEGGRGNVSCDWEHCSSLTGCFDMGDPQMRSFSSICGYQDLSWPEDCRKCALPKETRICSSRCHTVPKSSHHTTVTPASLLLTALNSRGGKEKAVLSPAQDSFVFSCFHRGILRESTQIILSSLLFRLAYIPLWLTYFCTILHELRG